MSKLFIQQPQSMRCLADLQKGSFSFVPTTILAVLRFINSVIYFSVLYIYSRVYSRMLKQLLPRSNKMFVRLRLNAEVRLL